MTVILAWNAAEDQRLWVVSDSRLSNAGSSGGAVILTDHGAKILEIPVCLAVPGQSGFFDTPIHQTRLGFAYAGSSLIALQAYAAVIPLWSRLASAEPISLPTLDQFGNHLAVFLESYAKEIGASGGDCRCECLLTGWDNNQSRPVAVAIETAGNDGRASVRAVQFEGSNPEILGSDKESVRDAFDKLEADPRLPNEPLNRRPLRYIRSTLKNTPRTDIGGGVQIGVLSRAGFEIYFDVQPPPTGQQYSDAHYRGFPLSKIQRLGETFIALSGTV